MDLDKLHQKRVEEGRDLRKQMKMLGDLDFADFAEFPEPFWVYLNTCWNSCNLRFCYPASFKERDVIDAVLTAKGWHKENTWDYPNEFTDRWTKKDVKLTLLIDWNVNLKGATCVRRVIGKEMVEKEIIEFVCQEAASA